MRNYWNGLLLGLPLLALLFTWRWLPNRVVIHSAQPDRWIDRNDFGGVVVGVTVGIALAAYGLLQIQLVFQPMTKQQQQQAYTAIVGGAAFIGLLVLSAGLFGN